MKEEDVASFDRADWLASRDNPDAPLYQMIRALPESAIVGFTPRRPQ